MTVDFHYTYTPRKELVTTSKYGFAINIRAAFIGMYHFTRRINNNSLTNMLWTL